MPDISILEYLQLLFSAQREYQDSENRISETRQQPRVDSPMDDHPSLPD